MAGELIKVCSPNARPSVQNTHSKGHQHWRKDPWHITAEGSGKTLCGRDCREYLRVGEYEDHDVDDFHLCDRCGQALSS